MQTIFDDFYLLLIHEEKGTVVGSARKALRYGLAGALLAELALQNYIHMGKNNRLEADETLTSNDPILAQALQKIQTNDGLQKAGAWVKAFSKGSRTFGSKITERLVGNGLATQEDDRLIWVLPEHDSKKSYTPSARYQLKDILRSMILANGPVDLRYVVLVGLVQACDLLELIFTKDERKLATRKIYELTMNEAMRNPVVQIIQEIDEAVASLVSTD